MQYTVAIPGWIPNPRRRRETRKLVAAHCQRMGVPVCPWKRQVTLTFQVQSAVEATDAARSSMSDLVMDALLWSGMVKGGGLKVSASVMAGASEPFTTIELVDLIGEEVPE